MYTHSYRDAVIVPTCNGIRPTRVAPGAFEGLVAAPGFSETSVFTSPNQNFVPQFAIAHNEIITYTDGRWGLHEYSRWPQAFDRAYIHVACIPRKGARGAPQDEIVWRTWQAGDWTTVDCGVPRFGNLKRQYMHELTQAAERGIAGVRTCRRDCASIASVADFIIVCLRHCLDRLRVLPSERSVIISLAAHVQRLVLELAGIQVYLEVVYDRIISSRDHHLDVLDVVGAHTGDASVAQLLHRVGIPVWFQQHLTPAVRIWASVHLTELPVSFSSTPSWPRLVLATRDLSGALNTPGEAQRAMNAIVRRQLCSSLLPELVVAEECDVASGPSKRQRLEPQWTHGWDSTIGGARSTLVVQHPRHTGALAHALPMAPQSLSAGRRAMTSRHAPRAHAPALASSFTMNPFRQHYDSSLLSHSRTWADALAAVSPLPQPSKSVTYFLPPPWLLDRLRGYSVSAEKTHRYVHHWLSIRVFCRLRLYDRTISGRPLTISEWRDALWGDYGLDSGEEKVSSATDTSAKAATRVKVRHGLKQNLRRLFGNLAGLPSYDPAARPSFDDRPVTRHEVSKDDDLRARIVWEVYETNWRCELLAADALMVGSRAWPEVERWVREGHISEVWGPSRSGMNIAPDGQEELPQYCWPPPDDDDWLYGRGALQAFVELLARWQNCPDTLRSASSTLSDCDPQEYGRVQSAVVTFYVQTFVQLFERLPTPPMRPPRLSRSHPNPSPEPAPI